MVCHKQACETCHRFQDIRMKKDFLISLIGWHSESKRWSDDGLYKIKLENYNQAKSLVLFGVPGKVQYTVHLSTTLRFSTFHLRTALCFSTVAEYYVMLQYCPFEYCIVLQYCSVEYYVMLHYCPFEYFIVLQYYHLSCFCKSLYLSAVVCI